LLTHDTLFVHDALSVNAAGAKSNGEPVNGASGTMVADSHKALFRRDWSNQELADLYRVEALLVQANIRIETTRGLSDEGDPWFVFCHADGEVFVHLARIDGIYVLDGPGLDSVLRGESFAALIDRFASAVTARAPTGNIVQFRPGKRDAIVRLHPAVMLAAMVWSLYLASDHFVGAAHAGEMDAGDGHAALFPSLIPAQVEPSAEAIREQVDIPARFDADASRKVAVDDMHRLIIREAELSRNSVSGDSAGAYWSMTSSAAGIAAGLTAIAISFGLYDSKFDERTHDAVSFDATETSGTAVTSAHTGVLQQGFVPAEKVILESQDAVAARAADKVETVAATLKLGEHALTTPAHLNTEVTVDQAMQATAASAVPPPQLNEKTIVTLQAEAASSHAAVLATVTPDEAQDLQSLVALATQHLGQISTYKLADVSVDATFDVSTLSKQTAQLVLEDLSGQNTTLGKAPIDDADSQLNSLPQTDIISQYLPYDATAKSFVYQFLLKSQSIEMIKSNNMVVFVDTSAVDDSNDHPYSVSWIADDHTIISTIGHAQDFDGYLLS
jgi:hypothetical protein